MITKTLSIKIIALKLGCKPEEVLVQLEEKSFLIEELLGVPRDGQLIIRDGYKRYGVDADGKVIAVVERDPDRTLVPDAVSLVRTMITTPESNQILEGIKSRQDVRAEFMRLWPTQHDALDAFLKGTGCAMCRNKVVSLLKADDIRKNQLLEFIKTVSS